MNKSTVIALEDRAESLDPLTELLRVGARQLIEQAVEMELQELLAAHADRLLADGRAGVVRNGYLYQVQTNVRATQVVIEERGDGTLRITHQGHVLAYARIAARPGRPAVPQTEFRRHRPVTQARTHPWRKRALPPRALLAAGPIT